MTYKLVTAATGYPITLAIAQDHLRVNGITGHDDRINRAIAAATEYVEKYTGRPLLTQHWARYLDFFPCHYGKIELAKAPVGAIDSLKYVDTDGILQTLDPSNYELDAQSETAYVALAYQCYWPATRCKVSAVQVTFTCGYGDASAVPSAIKSAILLMVEHLFRNTSAVNLGQSGISSELAFGLNALLSPYCIGEFA